MRKKREYLELLEKAKGAGSSAIDIYNRVFYAYKDEATLMLFSNAWELLAKAVLVKNKKSILVGNTKFTITGEVAVHRLRNDNIIEESQEDLIQQIISLRNAATHHILPNVPVEIMHHLLFFGCKFFRQIVSKYFPAHAKDFPDHHLALSFGDLTTYADRVQKLVSKIRKSKDEKHLIWLLERGIDFDGSKYITERQFERKFQGKRGAMKYLSIGSFIDKTDMVRLIPIEAPKNFTADIKLRKGDVKNLSLPIVVQKTDVNVDYPFLTTQVADILGKNVYFISKMVSALNIKGDARYHQAIQSSKSGSVQKYNEAAVQKMRQYLHENPAFNPYK